VLLVTQRVLDRQDAAPGMAEQEEAAGIEPESLAHLLELVDEPVDLPERGVVRLVAEGRPSWS